MNSKALSLLAMAAIVLAGCLVPAVHPFYTEKQLEFDPALIGNWKETGKDGDSKSSWAFTQKGDKAYELITADSDSTNTLTVHLFRLKGHLFMDWLMHQEKSAPGIPAHYVFKVGQIQPALQVSTLKLDYVTELAQKNPSIFHHTFVYDNPSETNTYHIVLTGETEELQKIVGKLMDNTNAWSILDDRTSAPSGK